MTEIIIRFDNPHLYERVIKFLGRLKISYQVRSDKTPFNVNWAEGQSTTLEEGDDIEEILAVRQRLHEKYVITGEWHKMDDDERQDASLLEMMLYKSNDPDNVVVSTKETDNVLAQLKAGTYGR